MNTRKKINLLEQNVINQIAAGEVIEAPYSAVKELVENAIDAESTEIRIEISKGGKELIKVTDNGIGIAAEELKTAFLPHTTSKLRKLEDLEKIESLGFRGEALASIVSVSKVEIYTKTSESEVGMYGVFEEGRLISCKPTGCPNGTTIIIHKLFSKTPARLKYLKSDGVESSKITELITRMALSKTNIAFQYVNNNNVMLTTRGDDSIQSVVETIFPRELSSSMIAGKEVSLLNHDEKISITGLIGQPHATRGNRSYQVFFVNNRLVKSNFLSKIFESAYKDSVMINRYPVGILYFSIPSTLIDVNVHPAKTTVKFFDEKIIDDLFTKFVQTNLFQQTNIVTSGLSHDEVHLENYKAYTPKSLDISTLKSESTIVDRKEPKKCTLNHDSNNMYQTKNETPTVQENILEVYESSKKNNEYLKYQNNHDQHSNKQSYFINHVLRLKNYHFIGQIFNTYLILESSDSIYYIDQHAAHERIVYESMLQAYLNRDVSVQHLIDGQILDLSPMEIETLNNHITIFSKIGIELQPYGPYSYRLMTVPYEMGIPVSAKWIKNLLDELSVSNKNDQGVPYEKIIRKACRYAIKANDHLVDEEINSLLNRIQTLNPPLTCPHGRPIVVQQKRYEIERLFKRV
ncbi:DNA mismatch repair endonuclease MutL [Tindallia californiensis]|uniref:DNA mismatch repair protein MutL n=1 Tax=Tindallia californiensis TaxID=159292 RepID=A0A1H3NLQ9_9FIRM|nr:DNA mismatch repair endonuclease MutL [Tindallia californiensis]SDY89738.1 DNA mismatch repair protein MutL [Tindallia californiensis]